MNRRSHSTPCRLFVALVTGCAVLFLSFAGSGEHDIALHEKGAALIESVESHGHDHGDHSHDEFDASDLSAHDQSDHHHADHTHEKAGAITTVLAVPGEIVKTAYRVESSGLTGHASHGIERPPRSDC